MHKQAPLFPKSKVPVTPNGTARTIRHLGPRRRWHLGRVPLLLGRTAGLGTGPRNSELVRWTQGLDGGCHDRPSGTLRAVPPKTAAVCDPPGTTPAG